MIWKTNGKELDLSREARVMGILNVTPDSFSDGGRFADVAPAVTQARQMISEGAAIIDIGGESTRPGATEVTPAEEISRTIPVIEKLRKEWSGLISIDTRKAAVAEAALIAGADIVNDVSGLTADPEMAGICAASRCGIVVMHMRGTPADMQDDPRYEDVVRDVRGFFEERLETLSRSGIDPQRICFDPGIGFGKTFDHNLALLRSLHLLPPGGRPLLLGASRKSFLAKLCDIKNPADRDAATVAVTTLARGLNVMLHRVHDVKANLAALRVAESISGSHDS